VATEIPPLLKQFLDKLDQDSIQHTGGLQYMARCPAHDDNRASLSVSWGDKGRVIARCHADCEFSDITKALGLSKRDLQPERKEVAVYPYRNEDDELIYEVVRFDPKEFRQRRPDPDHKGRHVWNLQGVELIPYNLPEVAELIEYGDEESVLWIVEGEKDVHALQDAYAEVATCNSGGAGKWTDAHSEYLRGFKGQIIIVADDDDKPTKPGQKHALQVYESVERVAGITAQLAYPQGKDAAEHVGDHDPEDFIPLTPDQLRAEIADAARDTPSAEDEREARVAEVAEHMRVQREARALLAAEGWEAPPAQGSWAEQLLEPEDPINWLIPDLAFEGANVVINAQAKSGKTTLILNVAHSLLGGDPLFGHFPVAPLAKGRSVAWWNAELSERQAKAWLRNFELPRPEDFYPLHLRGYAMPFDSDATEEWTVAWLKDRGVSVWLIDPQSALFTGDENSNTEVGAWLAAIDRIKRRAGVETLFLVHHVAETAAAEESDNPNAGRLLKGRGASRQTGWADVMWSYAGRFDEPRYLSALGRDVDMDRFGGLSMESNSRLLRFSGQRSTPTIDRRNDLALKAVDAVAEHDGPIKAGDLQALLPNLKADPKRRAIEYAVQQGWLAKADGPRNSTLYSPGERDPRSLKLNIRHEITEED
jgi:hypothetical protein